MDEFSDFQMAVHTPAPSVMNVGLPFKNGVSSGKVGVGGNLRFPDSSPVHSLSSHQSTNTKADYVRSQISSSLLPPPQPPVQKFGTNVGSRLANYDLGLSVPPTQQTNGFQGSGGGSTNLSTNTFIGLSSKTINNPIRNNNQDLLIGEEDKYSALRMLIETDMESTTSIFENPSSIVEAKSDPPPPPVQMQFYPMTTNTSTTTIVNNTSLNFNAPPPVNYNSNLNFDDVKVTTNHSSSSVNTNLSSALQSSTTTEQDSPVATSADSSSDFGDFQSFTGFTTGDIQQNGLQSQPEIQLPTLNKPVVGFSGLFDNIKPILQVQSVSANPMPSSTLPILQKQEDVIGSNSDVYENGTCDSDGEFGDFVSVEPIPTSQQAPTVPFIPVVETASNSNVNNFNQSFDLPLARSVSPPKPVRKDLDNEATAIFANNLPTTTDDFQQNVSPIQVKHPAKQKFSEDDINNIVLGQGLDWESSAVGMDAMKSANPPPPPFLPSLTPSSFIRTSLIRNDEVTDIDPVKWNQTVTEEGNNDVALDFNSFDKKDFSSSNGKSKFLDVSPETRSIASLDLGSYVTVDYPENGASTHNNNNNNNGNKSFDQPVLMQNPPQSFGKPNGTPSMPSMALTSEEAAYDDDFDKYQCFRDECENETERYCAEWIRCLESCKVMISKALSVFNNVSTSEVIRELVSDEKGYSYVINIFEVYQISRRILKSAEKVGLEPKVRNVCLEIKNSWETLTAFLLGTCVSSEICQDVCEDDYCDSTEPLPFCGVCLCQVDTSQSSQFLDYGGKIYHCKCANFWVNAVDAILPSLSYVSNVTKQQQPFSKFDKISIL